MKISNIVELDFTAQENKKIRIESEVAIEFICGESSLTLLPNGEVVIKGRQLLQTMDQVVIQANRVDLCSS